MSEEAERNRDPQRVLDVAERLNHKLGEAGPSGGLGHFGHQSHV
jgi:hypothetical protein